MKNCVIGKRVYPSSLFSTNLANDNYTLTNLYPCHCVSFDVKAEINKYIKVNEVGVGLKIEL